MLCSVLVIVALCCGWFFMLSVLSSFVYIYGLTLFQEVIMYDDCLFYSFGACIVTHNLLFLSLFCVWYTIALYVLVAFYAVLGRPVVLHPSPEQVDIQPGHISCYYA